MRLPALLSLSVLSIASAPHTLLGAVPPGFDDLHVVDVPAPTALAQLPDRRILVASQGGELWLVEADGSPSRSLALDLSSRTCSNSERGLLGVEVDPDFAATRHVFVYYTFRRNGSCSAPVNRVSRFRMPGSTIDPASETVLLDGMLSFAGNHNAGDLVIGKDGMLYVSVGDGGCDFRGDSGCAGQNDAARDRDTLLGKVARITRSGDVPADNPFQGAGTARCNQGNAPSGQTCREIWATGLRNPFRMALDPERFHHPDLRQRRRTEPLGRGRHSRARRRLRLERARGRLPDRLDHPVSAATAAVPRPDPRLPPRLVRMLFDHRRGVRARRRLAGGIRRTPTCSPTSSAVASSVCARVGTESGSARSSPPISAAAVRSR